MAAGIQIGAAFFGSLGFALLFNLGRRHLFWAALGGAAAWAIYLAIGEAVPRVGIQSFGAALFLGLYSEILARMAAVPTTTFLVVGFIPLIPGFSLYHTTAGLVAGRFFRAGRFGVETVTIAGALAAGLVVSMILCQMILQSVRLIGKRAKNK
jgi:uncharacterized membrane protein YjjB (DUF3815 family)